MTVFEMIFEHTVLALYSIALVLIVVYSFGQLHLVITFLKNRWKRKPLAPLQGNEDLPFVTIQLPIYNERFVAERLLDAMAALDYPKDKFEVQVLDDSDDATLEVVAKKVAELKAEGYLIEQVRRPERVGFKAGALEYGLNIAKGEFIAIFDADFLPYPDFLRASLPYFQNEKIGVVQTRWEHINQDYSFFTEIQAFHLDAHFTVEQFSRDVGGYLLNFNGTAGLWRKQCIIEAGGWQHDTLTEDLDLSYRAQLKGWQFTYVDNIGAPAELPAEMGAIKSQQYRWMKGGAEVARKMLWTLWTSDESLGRKIHGSFHLLSSSVFIMTLLLGAMSVPLLYIKHEFMNGSMGFLLIPVGFLMLSFFILALLYFVTFQHREGSFKAGLRRFAINFLPFLSMTMGLSLHNSIAVIQGYLGKRTPFIRTPKFNLTSKKDKVETESNYYIRKVKPSVYLEIFLAIYFCFGIALSFYFLDFAVLPFFLMEAIGFGVVGYFSFRHALVKL